VEVTPTSGLENEDILDDCASFFFLAEENIFRRVCDLVVKDFMRRASCVEEEKF
jgi:hypothetical protein